MGKEFRVSEEFPFPALGAQNAEPVFSLRPGIADALLQQIVGVSVALMEPDTNRQLIYSQPSAIIGTHAFSAGMYSIKHLPRSSLR